MSSLQSQLVPRTLSLARCELAQSFRSVDSADHAAVDTDCDRAPRFQSTGDGCVIIAAAPWSQHILTQHVDLGADANGRSDPYVRVRLLSAQGDPLGV